MPERTIRQEIMAVIVGSPMTAKDISQIIRISEKEVHPHLEHIALSLRNDKEKKLLIEPSRCHQCGFVFKERRRLTSPSRCPRCRHEEISPQVFSIAKVNRSLE